MMPEGEPSFKEQEGRLEVCCSKPRSASKVGWLSTEAASKRN